MESAAITDPAILIRIKKTYRPGMSETAMYEATRGIWKVGIRRQRAELAMAVVDAVIVGVYDVENWHPAGSTPYTTRDQEKFKGRPDRWEFTGRSAGQEVQDRYVGRSVASVFTAGNRNPIRYVNC